MMNLNEWANHSRKTMAICHDLKIPDNEARLICYMGYIEKNRGPNYFENPDPREVSVLKLMLGIEDDNNEYEMTFEPACSYDGVEDETAEIDSHEVEHLLRRPSEFIAEIDKSIRDNLGMENRLRIELEHRLKFYTDQIYRSNLIIKYNKIKKVTPFYTDVHIDNIINRCNLEQEALDNELNSLLQ